MNIKKLKDFILKQAKITSPENVKLGKMGSWATLPGNIKWFIPQLNMWVKGTCGKHCRGCFNDKCPKKSRCYVFKSYCRHTNRNKDGSVGDIVTGKCWVKYGHAIRTLAMQMFLNELLVSLDNQLCRKKKPFKIVRINESGELTCVDELDMWCELARRHTETIFYIYTKNYDAVKECSGIPSNMFINISIWHENGISDFLSLKDNPQINAFVLVDKEWDIEKYSKHGLEIEDMCPAYNEKGKLNHNVTCDRCPKCHSGGCKIIGCYEH